MKQVVQYLWSASENRIVQALAALELALLASFVLLLVNTLLFEQYSGFHFYFLPNVDVYTREIERVYAASLGFFLCIRLVLLSRQQAASELLGVITLIAATVSANIGVVILATSSLFIFTSLLVPLAFYLYLQFRHSIASSSLISLKTLLPGAYLVCSILWFASVLYPSGKFTITPALPEGTIDRIEAEVAEILEGRDPCMYPTAGIMLTPFGHMTAFRTSYDTQCGADGLIEHVGADKLASFLIAAEWIGGSSVVMDDVVISDVMAQQIVLWEQIRRDGYASLSTDGGAIYFYPYVEGPSEPMIMEEPVMEEF